jgi:hypothetical protein
MVQTNESAYSLYYKEKDYCDKHYIHVSSKNTKIEYTNRIGYLTGIYVKIASPKYYIKDIKEKLNITEKLIDVKKEFIYEKGKYSKVLMVYATENDADQINEEFSKLKLGYYQYVSYKKISSDKRLGSIHYNEMINIKARYEILFDASLNERVLVESRR